MRRITKQRLWYEGSRIVCMASVVGLMSALGRMEWGELPTGKGMTLAAVFLLTAALFGRLAETIGRRLRCTVRQDGQTKKEAA